MKVKKGKVVYYNEGMLNKNAPVGNQTKTIGKILFSLVLIGWAPQIFFVI